LAQHSALRAPKVLKEKVNVLIKLSAAGRIPPQKLHFRCIIGLTVNLSKSFLCD